MLPGPMHWSTRWPLTKVGRERGSWHVLGVHQIDSIDMLAAKMDLLMKRMESPNMKNMEQVVT